ncbi:MAG TPA: hypothetical protein VGZ29_05990 [Terriglobia bacterium]|nr:hypothetical protein [Terriglobia bacterium]
MSDFREALYYNPHIFWDPIGPPWENKQLDPGAQRQLALVRLNYQQDLLAAQTKAVQAAKAVLEKANF